MKKILGIILISIIALFVLDHILVYYFVYDATGGSLSNTDPGQQAAYDKALTLIEKAKADNDISLSLSHSGLTQVPPEIGELTSMEWLDLSNNALTALPPEIGELDSLKYLYLYDNAITSFPTDISELTSLVMLVLHENELTSLPEEMANLTSLNQLYLNDNKLKVLPQWITQLDMEIVWEDKSYRGKGINVYGNPLEEPPIEVVKQGKAAIKAWFDEKNK
ncbi:MAG: leucine-rich repeat domain-containing protein [Phycisphaerae bacterium]|nr:leucine-rich repeat domain-containing protein [Phycisphaerae bacterium]